MAQRGHVKQHQPRCCYVRSGMQDRMTILLSANAAQFCTVCLVVGCSSQAARNDSCATYGEQTSAMCMQWAIQDSCCTTMARSGCLKRCRHRSVCGVSGARARATSLLWAMPEHYFATTARGGRPCPARRRAMSVEYGDAAPPRFMRPPTVVRCCALTASAGKF